MKYLLLSPITTLLWYLDEILFPAYQCQTVRPMFIIGQPRSGTTLLHRTLAADDKTFFAVRHIEWRYPYITLQKIFAFFKLFPKLKRMSYWPSTNAGEMASRMHPNTLCDFEEDGIFYEECFLHHFFIFLRFPYPELLSYLDNYPALKEQVQEDILATHRKVVQKVMYLRRGSGLLYLSKEVTSHNKIPRLLHLYPDAHFLLIVRHSSEFMNSLLALVRNSTLAKTGVDPATIPGWKSALIERMRNDSLLLVDLCENRIDAKQQTQVSFNGFTRDIGNTVHCIYSRIDRIPDAAYLQYLSTLGGSQHNRDRGYDYRRRVFVGFEPFDKLVVRVETRSACSMRTLA